MQLALLKKNIGFSIFNYVIVNILKFFVRLFFVRTLSMEYLGLNGLFSNILAFLSLAELGLGPAIVYSLYKPLALQERETIKSLMALFQRVYIIIGFVIFGLGICLYPWLDVFVKEQPKIDNWQLFYLAFLINTAISYFWSYQRNLLIADQKQYIVNIYQAFVQVIIAVCQIVLLLSFANYWLYLFMMILGTLLENLILNHKAYNYYPYLKEKSVLLQEGIKDEIITNTKAMLIHKFAGIIVFSSSNIILSKYVGLTAVGVFSNYLLVTSALTALAGKLFEAVTATFGHAMTIDDLEQKQNNFRRTQFITFWLSSVVTVGLYVLLNPFIELWLGKEFLLDNTTVTLFVFSFYLTFMRKAVLMFRDACGLFWQDRYKAVVETFINIFASVYLTQLYGIRGLILASILSTILTCLWLEPYILFKYELQMSLKEYFLNYFGSIVLTGIAIGACSYLVGFLPQGYVYFALECIGIPIFVTAIWGIAHWYVLCH